MRRILGNTMCFISRPRGDQTPALSLMCAGEVNQWNPASRHPARDSREREDGRSIVQSGRVISSGRMWIEIAAVERLDRRGTRMQELFLGSGHAIRTKCRRPTPWHFADQTKLREWIRARANLQVQAITYWNPD